METIFFILQFDDLTNDAQERILDAFGCEEPELQSNILSIVVFPKAEGAAATPKSSADL